MCFYSCLEMPETWRIIILNTNVFIHFISPFLMLHPHNSDACSSFLLLCHRYLILLHFIPNETPVFYATPWQTRIINFIFIYVIWCVFKFYLMDTSEYVEYREFILKFIYFWQSFYVREYINNKKSCNTCASICHVKI